MAEVTIDGELFVSRVNRIFESWKQDLTEFGLWKGATAICLVNGKTDKGKGADEPKAASKTINLLYWLFGVEFTSTMIYFLGGKDGEPRRIVVYCGKTQEKILRDFVVGPCAQNGIEMTLLLTNKWEPTATPEEKAAVKDAEVTRLAGTLGTARVFGLPDRRFMEKAESSEKAVTVGELFGKLVSQVGASLVDAGPAFTTTLADKTPDEIDNVTKAAQMGDYVMKKVLSKQFVDNDPKPHSTLSNDASAVTDGNELTEKFKLDDSKIKDLSPAYPPIVQSGGGFNLSYEARPNDKVMDINNNSSIVLGLGLRYQFYVANIIRTYLVEPSDELKDIYEAVLEAQLAAIETARSGTKMKAVHGAAEKVLEKIEGFEKVINVDLTGFVVNEASYPEYDFTIRKGFTLHIAVGVKGKLASKDEEGSSRKFAVWIGDTILIQDDGTALVLTPSTKKELDKISLEGTADEESGDAAVVEDGTGVILTTRTRKAAVTSSAADKDIRARQAELAKRKQEEALGRLQTGARGAATQVATENKSKVIKAFGSTAEYPSRIEPCSISVDAERQVVFFPIYGQMVPFHISTIKNLNKLVDGKFTYLRVNFLTPGQAVGGLSAPALDDANAHFVKELTYRAENANNLNNMFRLISNQRKKIQDSEKEKREMVDVVKQDRLILSDNAVHLSDINARPSLGAKKGKGILEAHSNGLRFVSKTERLDIIYSNIRFAFFQDCTGELIVLLHFHLRHPIMVGKKKTFDIQFYTEVTEAVTNLRQNNSSMYDRDEIEDEQRERQLRTRLNNEFQNFAQKIEDRSRKAGYPLEFDKPYRELGFNGVALKTTVLLLPTSSCLVHLIEGPPFFVLALEDIEIANFERVTFQLRNFDIVFVMKDFSKPVVTVSAVPIDSLQPIKEWLTMVDVKFYENKVNLNWPNILKIIRQDPEAFFEDGGWRFLGDEDEDEEGEGEDGELISEGSEFVPDSDYSETDSEEFESDEDYSDSESGSGGSGDDDDDDDDDEEEEEEESDWEEKAARADRKKDKGKGKKYNSDDDFD